MDEWESQKKEHSSEQIKKVKEDLMKQFEGQESKEEYPEGNILNSNTLDNIAKLEAIDAEVGTKGEFDQERYDLYINSYEYKQIKESQKSIKQQIEEGIDPEDAFLDAPMIYGNQGLNRYSILETGQIMLRRGSGITSGFPEYKIKLIQKAKEFGIEVEKI